ncbi:hypothetical protein HAX54_020099, partial [Datura stramonium]|nr:hypothetical protein [Datura stramonium]
FVAEGEEEGRCGGGEDFSSVVRRGGRLLVAGEDEGGLAAGEVVGRAIGNGGRERRGGRRRGEVGFVAGNYGSMVVVSGRRGVREEEDDGGYGIFHLKNSTGRGERRGTRGRGKGKGRPAAREKRERRRRVREGEREVGG